MKSSTRGRGGPSHAELQDRFVAHVARIEGVDPNLVREGVPLIRLHRQVEMLIEERLAGWGMTARQIDILELLHVSDEGLTPAELADEVGLSRSAMTGTLDGLERRGYARRTPHAADRRMVLISLTAKGREFIARKLPERVRVLQLVYGALSAEERKTVLRAYRKVLEVLGHGLPDSRGREPARRASPLNP
jgi:DNA-binding MarR family transcriptional regulator